MSCTDCYVYDILTKFNLGLGHYVPSLNYDLMKRKAINIQYFFYKNIGNIPQAQFCAAQMNVQDLGLTILLYKGKIDIKIG
jgi:hypothetical protein